MSRDSDAFQRIQDSKALQRHLLAWLLQDPSQTASPPDGSSSSPLVTSSNEFADNPEIDEWDPLDSETFDAGFSGSNISEGFSPNFGEQSISSGEIPAVQDRFQALLKRRLQAEIQRHPPLFPWEKEILDYEAEGSDRTVSQQVPTQPWIPQLQNLGLPVPIPEPVLVQLLEQCRNVVKAPLLEGAKLVRAVENLFPGQSQMLNQLAELILRSPSMVPSRTGPITQAAEEFPTEYESATPTGQMALSLMAARAIFGALTLEVSSSQPSVERQWLTAAGLVTLEVESRLIEGGNGSVRVQALLPEGGSLQLLGNNATTTAQRQDSGTLSVELFEVQPQQTYSLEIKFHDREQNPLIFAIAIAP